MELKEPLMESVRKLSQEEFDVLMEIPKYFREPEKVVYERSGWKNFMTSTFFWVSAPLFTVELLCLLIRLFNVY
jgi:hypothetical protein